MFKQYLWIWNQFPFSENFEKQLKICNRVKWVTKLSDKDGYYLVENRMRKICDRPSKRFSCFETIMDCIYDEAWLGDVRGLSTLSPRRG
ncbi:unnamed protein product [Callosobruchus maculatus]|uniref:Uncharacterized protein n=1 Tax=Callosobruchus maculatus TaxID=64391 RepID=A0A653BS33_CALMS|nr:unnamed protein product [Callosobruchus maculatus]